ncbi:sugar isomerase domain-containing protein [Ruminococcaceae bacterium OttesenSCG-928-D13]|nr:sugar isomerase domain-containing protein [Ruminococcaceae bacterium OttesenSCG-928-D13]
MIESGFFDHCEKLMQEIRDQEIDKIHQAAEMVAEAVAASKTFIIHDRGHLIGGELLGRAGGPAFVRRLDMALPDPGLIHPDTGVRPKCRDGLTGEARLARMRRFEMEYTDYLFDMNGLGAGDVLLLNSNSGFGFSATAIAHTAKAKGLKLIVISSKATAEAITPEGGDKKLADYADLLFDNHAPYGDAVFEVAGLGEKLWPASGLGAAYIAWPIVLCAVEKLLERGVEPTILRSLNIPGGVEQNVRARERYEGLGY